MPELERYMLALLARLDGTLRQAVDDFDFNTYVRALTDFCNEDLSAFFFDIRKDSLYCDAAADPKRRAYRTVLDTLFHALVRYAAPVLVFTAEEVWADALPGRRAASICSSGPTLPAMPDDDARRPQWDESARAARRRSPRRSSRCAARRLMGSSLEAEVTPLPDRAACAGDVDLAELFIVAKVTPKGDKAD